MEYLFQVVVTKRPPLVHATCLRCGLRVAARSERLLKKVLQAHVCHRDERNKSSVRKMAKSQST